MKQWKFSDQFGGGTYSEADRSVTTVGQVWLTIPDVGARLFPVDVLTEVKPPMPEEAPNESFVRVGRQVHRRDDMAAIEDANWFGAGFATPHTWAELCERGTPHLLVPAPEPVELPWDNGQGRELGVTYDDNANVVWVRVFDKQVGASATESRAMARALCTAADANDAANAGDEDDDA